MELTKTVHKTAGVVGSDIITKVKSLKVKILQKEQETGKFGKNNIIYL